MIRQTCFAGLAAGLVLAAAPPAPAEEWTRSGPRGTVTRSAEPGSGSWSVERSGARGGSASATVTCGPGAGVVCRRDFSATGPGGRTASGSTLTRHGPFRSIRRGTVTGPRGATAAGVRAVPRWRRRW